MMCKTSTAHFNPAPTIQSDEHAGIQRSLDGLLTLKMGRNCGAMLGVDIIAPQLHPICSLLRLRVRHKVVTKNSNISNIFMCAFLQPTNPTPKPPSSLYYQIILVSTIYET